MHIRLRQSARKDHTVLFSFASSFTFDAGKRLNYFIIGVIASNILQSG